MTLAWEGVSDAVSYEVLRDDRPIATSDTTSVEVPRGGENRFFVRAVRLRWPARRVHARVRG